jgi:hypothetical protein
MAGEATNPSGTTPRWIPHNVRTRGGALDLGAFYLLLGVTSGAWMVTTEDVLIGSSGGPCAWAFSR